MRRRGLANLSGCGPRGIEGGMFAEVRGIGRVDR